VRALAGITVLDLTRLLPGASATAYLAQNGADVIKIEQPGDGDYARSLDPEVFASTNGGKRSVGLNLKDPRGRELLLRLADRADVLIEGNRPGAMLRLGLGYDKIRERNRRLIYASLTGYGQDGPYAMLAGHDVNYLALGGVLSMNLPVIPGVQFADLAAGAMQAVSAILTALFERERTGEGRYLDVSMLAGVKSFLTVPLGIYRRTGREPESGNEVLSGRYACYSLYRAGDGRWLAVGALEAKFWAELCRRLGCPDLIPRQFDSTAKESLAAIFAMRPAEEWFELLRDSDCCVTPVRTVGEIAGEIGPPAGPPAPALGEHTRSILRDCGIGDEEFSNLRAEGVIQ